MRSEAAQELFDELEQLIIAAAHVQSEIDGCSLTDQDFGEWANLVFGFNCALGNTAMAMQIRRKDKELH